MCVNTCTRHFKLVRKIRLVMISFPFFPLFRHLKSFRWLVGPLENLVEFRAMNKKIKLFYHFHFFQTILYTDLAWRFTIYLCSKTPKVGKFQACQFNTCRETTLIYTYACLDVKPCPNFIPFLYCVPIQSLQKLESIWIIFWTLFVNKFVFLNLANPKHTTYKSLEICFRLRTSI